MRDKVLGHNNELADRLNRSAKRTAEAEQRLEEQYDRVRCRYSPPGKNQTRNTWYSGSLYDLAKAIGKEAEYDTFVATYQGCVHSSAMALQHGPPVSPAYVLMNASVTAARVALINVEHNHLPMTQGDRAILDEVCKSILDARK